MWIDFFYPNVRGFPGFRPLGDSGVDGDYKPSTSEVTDEEATDDDNNDNPEDDANNDDEDPNPSTPESPRGFPGFRPLGDSGVDGLGSSSSLLASSSG